MGLFGMGNKRREWKEKNSIPENVSLVQYYKGYPRDINSFLGYWFDDGLNICELNIKNNNPFKIKISKDDIISFTVTGDITAKTTTKGGGVSLGGAAVGAAVFGPAGAIIGGRKKSKTTTQTFDTRKVALKFKEDGVERSILLGHTIYDDLCLFCMEKLVG